jgi:hypothetical protein
MKHFYEVRRQLNNPIQWTHEAYFQNREDAEIFVKYRTKMMRARNPEFVNINLEIDKHKFFDGKTQTSDHMHGAGI